MDLSRRVWRSLKERLPRSTPTPAGEITPDVEAERLRGYPPPYPNGWFVLVRSEELRDEPVHVRALGEHFVVFRTSAGVAALDAYCPHLGANLAGGRVKDDCLTCPFHEWTFDATGQVVSIPYSDRTPATLKTRSWPVEERDGFVFVYYDGAFARTRGAPTPEPPYQLPRIEGIDDGSMVHRGDHDFGVVRMHLMEFAENSADSAHFAPLHGDMFVPWTQRKIPGLRVHHDATWEQDPDHEHITWFRNHAVIEVLGKRVERTAADAAICIAGPAGVVTFHFDIPDVGRIVLYQTHTPEAPLEQRIRFRWYADRKIPRVLVWYVVGNWISQWREDIAIWEHKVFRRKPMLVKGDGPLLEMRRWYARFYPGGVLFPE